MEIHTGSDRRVITGHKWTVKVARTNPRSFIKSVKYIREHRGLRGVVNTWRQESFDGYLGLKWHLFHGITANRREQRLALMSDLVIPTRGLLAGLINVQPTTEDAGITHDEVIGALADNLDQPGMNIPRLGHMLEDTANFGLHDGAIKFRDGGSSGLERILTKTNEEPNIKKALGSLLLKHS